MNWDEGGGEALAHMTGSSVASCAARAPTQ